LQAASGSCDEKGLKVEVGDRELAAGLCDVYVEVAGPMCCDVTATSGERGARLVGRGGGDRK